MSTIRQFRNADLPALADVWVRHWSLVAPPPSVTPVMIEQAILARTFFNPSLLLVVDDDGEMVAWCHCLRQPESGEPSVGTTFDLCAFCFVDHCAPAEQDQLLRTVESRIEALGCERIRVGPMRDVDCGYAGLAPIGHGIGVPSQDPRTTSLLSRAGYAAEDEVVRMVAATSHYRVPVSRESLELRRTTSIQQQTVLADGPRRASALSHLDVESHSLVRHHSGEGLAKIELWCSDPEAQVMSSSASILDLAGIHDRGQMASAESYLVASSVQSLGERRVISVETVVDRSKATLIEQLRSLKFEPCESGHLWTKSLR